MTAARQSRHDSERLITRNYMALTPPVTKNPDIQIIYHVGPRLPENIGQPGVAWLILFASRSPAAMRGHWA